MKATFEEIALNASKQAFEYEALEMKERKKGNGEQAHAYRLQALDFRNQSKRYLKKAAEYEEVSTD